MPDAVFPTDPVFTELAINNVAIYAVDTTTNPPTPGYVTIQDILSAVPPPLTISPATVTTTNSNTTVLLNSGADQISVSELLAGVMLAPATVTELEPTDLITIAGGTKQISATNFMTSLGTTVDVIPVDYTPINHTMKILIDDGKGKLFTMTLEQLANYFGSPPLPSEIALVSIGPLVAAGTTTVVMSYYNGKPDLSTLVFRYQESPASLSDVQFVDDTGTGATESGTFSFTFNAPPPGNYNVSVDVTGTYASSLNFAFTTTSV